MLIAAWSAFSRNPTVETFHLRLEQMEKIVESPVDPQIEAENFRGILQNLGINAIITVQSVKSIIELIQLCKQHDHVFVGFNKGQDDGNNNHFAHLGIRNPQGFRSEQQFTSDELLATQLSEQGKLTVFIVFQNG